MKKLIFCSAFLFLWMSVYSQNGSVIITPRPDKAVDTTMFYRNLESPTSIQTIFSSANKSGELYFGFNFGVGTSFNSNIKSNYPGFLGLGLQSGWKWQEGFLLELSYNYLSFSSDATYDISSLSYQENNVDISITNYLSGGEVSSSRIGLIVLYSDYLSPYIIFQHLYLGLGIGLNYISEEGMMIREYLETSGGTPIGSTVTSTVYESYQWMPRFTFIIGMNFLYLPQSNNWFSFDIRLDYSPNTNQRDGGLFRSQPNYGSIFSTMRFYFDASNF